MTEKNRGGQQGEEGLDSDCLESFDYVYSYINNELTDATEIARIENHLSHCRSCYSRAEMERKINERLQSTTGPEAPVEFKARLKNLIDEL